MTNKENISNIIQKTKDRNISQYLRETTNSDTNTPDITLISYDLQAGDYTRKDSLEFKKGSIYNTYNNLSDHFSEIIDNLNLENISLMEVGIGEGNMLYRVCNKLKTEISKVFGLDISLSRLLYAQDNCRKNNIQNLSLMCSDMATIPLPDNSIDVLYTCFSIEPNRGREEQILKELYRVSNKYLIILETSNEFGGKKVEEHIDRHCYVKDISKKCKSMGFDLVKEYMSPYYFNENNRPNIMIFKKNTSPRESCSYVSPHNHSKLINSGGNLFDPTDKQVFPVVKGITIFTESILCSKYLEFGD